MHLFRSLLGLFCLLAVMVEAADDYRPGPESMERGPGVPAGRVEAFQFSGSKIFPETTRDVWVYVPVQYDGSKPAALMVFQDGRTYVSTNVGSSMRVPIVFDNLIAKGEMPVTIGVFVNPGVRGEKAASNRSFEYDSLGDAYVRFLLEELLPHIEKTYQVRLSSDPALRAICGMSSGAICAWTAAWERPSAFGKVLSHIGSFTNIRGGHVYPALIRKTERKAIRVYLQDGANDLNNLHGNWPLANQEMASALAFAGYDFKFEMGTGSHNGKHGGASLPESLRWLWRPALAALPSPQTKDNLGGDEALSKVLADGGKPGDWELVGSGYAFTDAACNDAEGNFYFADLPKGVLYKAPAAGGVPQPWLEGGPKISGMKFGPGGDLFACVQGEGTNNVKRIVVIRAGTKAIETVATQVEPNDMVVARNGFLYYTDTGAGAVVRVPLSARGMSRPPSVVGGINKPNGITLSPDQSQLWVSEYGGTNVWNFLIAADGGLTGGERLAELRTPANRADSGGDGATTDATGRIYVTSHVGIQMFDATGRMGGVISRPQEKGTVSCAFAGAAHEWLYACSSDKVYRRKTLTRGVGGP